MDRTAGIDALHHIMLPGEIEVIISRRATIKEL
jgi:hypothetical protein